MQKQQTIGKSVSLTGVGLHTGVSSTVTFNPAPENYGIKFVRVDINGAPEIPGDIDYVADLSRGTALGIGDVRVYSVEHVLSCFAALGIDNCRVEVNAQEIPLMDGSMMPYVNLVKEAGIAEQDAEREYITLDKPVMYHNGKTSLCVFPYDCLGIAMRTDYDHECLGKQNAVMASLDEYESGFAPARTFCFLSEIQKLREQGLIKGGSLDSALVVQDVELTDEKVEYIKKLFDNYHGPVKAGTNGYLNDESPRLRNELCRHKVADLIGDLYLLGKPLKGYVLANRTGHAANIETAKKIREQIKMREYGHIKLTYEDITKILPHRYPFLLVDRVEHIIPDKEIVAFKNVSFNENFFNGHFPGNPVMPGVLQIEAIAQAAGIMGLYKNYVENKGSEINADVLFMGIDNTRFRAMVRPGDVLRIEVKMMQFKRGIGKFRGVCYVDDKIVCETDAMAMFQKKAT